MKFQEFEKHVRRTIPDTDANCVQNWCMGLAGEAGEFIELVKKSTYHGHRIDRDKLQKELGDILWYVFALGAHFEFDMEDVARLNVHKLRERYPEGFDEKRSVYRED